MSIFTVIGISILTVIPIVLILILVIMSNKKKTGTNIQDESNQAPMNELKFLTLGNILLFDEPKKTLKMINLEETKRFLTEDWEITSRESALDKIQWMFVEGRRAQYQLNYNELLKAIAEDRDHELKSSYYYIIEKLKDSLGITDEDIQNCKDLRAFDFEWLGIIVRGTYNIGYLSEDECYQCLESLYKMSASTYKSWKEYVIAFSIGHTIYLNNTDSDTFLTYAKEYLEGQDSLWSLYPLMKC